MPSLKELITANEDWLVRRILAYAKEHGYTRFSSTLEEPWRESICGFSEPMLRVLEDQGDAPPDLGAETDFVSEPLAAFAVLEAQRHRERGIPLELFLGLVKYYRQAYLDLIVEQGFERDEQERYRLFIERVFDHLEIAFCSEWLTVGEAGLLDEAHRKNRLLTNEKNKYLTIFESLTDPVILVDGEGRIENLNHAAASLFGSAAVPGQGYYAAQDYPLLERQIGELIERDSLATRVARTLDTQQGPRSFEVKRQRLLDVSEKFIGTVLILSDVTEYRQAKQQADSASRAKSAFLATMSHEIRTPITGILGICSLLKDEPLTATQAEYLKALVSSGEILLALVNDVLDYSKIEAEAVEVAFADFALRDLVEQVVDLVAAAARERALEVSVRIEEGLPERITGDQTSSRRILLNLVTNAVKFTPSGSVTVAVARSRAGIRFSVADTGVGIPEDIKPQLFEPFTQNGGSSGAEAGGTGLGLAICKKLATAIGGAIGFESREGVGSTFWFEFPLIEAESQAAAAEPAGLPPLPPLSVLLVEDNEVNRLVTEGFLERDGHETRVVESGEAALAALAAERADLVLMDVRMPGIGGLEAIRAIRALDDPETAAVPILVLTADLATTQEKSCLESGADGVLGKPFQPAALQAAMAQCLAKPEARRPAEGNGPPQDPLQRVLDEAVIIDHRRQLGPERAKRILEAFHLSAPGTLDAIKEAAGRGDAARVSDLAHALKSAAGNLGLLRLREAADRLEAVSRHDRPAALAEAVEQASGAFELSIEALESPEIADLFGS